MKVWRTIDNFFTEEETQEIIFDSNFHKFVSQKFNIKNALWYQKKIIKEILNDFADLSEAVQIEQWPHDPTILPLPEEHYDKDEQKSNEEDELVFPLCSAIAYLKVENLTGANLHLVRDSVDIVPETGKLVLLAPGVLHSVTPYVSGKRISMNLNFWHYYL